MWIVTANGSLVNLTYVDDIIIMSSEPDETDGVPNLGAKKALLARKVVGASENDIVGSILIAGDRGLCVEAMRSIAQGLKSGRNIVDFQVLGADQDGMKMATSKAPKSEPATQPDGGPAAQPSPQDPDGRRRAD